MPTIKFEDSNLLRKALDYARSGLPRGYSFKDQYGVWTLNTGIFGHHEVAMFSKDRMKIYLYDENERALVEKVAKSMEEFYGDATVIEISVR